MRATAATNALENGVDIAKAQEWLGCWLARCQYDLDLPERQELAMLLGVGVKVVV